MDRDAPIGLFDSGMGGLSVLSELQKALPGEHLIYYADSLHNPYGEKSRKEVLERSIQVCDELAALGVKAVIVACNTATSAAVDVLRKRYPFPVIGMEPALKPAAESSRPEKISVWATALTLQEKKFQKLLARWKKDHEIDLVPCPDLVRLVEENRLDDREAVEEALSRYLDHAKTWKPGSIVLGCTHFVFFRKQLHQLHPELRIYDGNRGTVRHLVEILEGANLLGNNEGSLTVINSNPEKLELALKLLQRLEEE